MRKPAKPGPSETVADEAVARPQDDIARPVEAPLHPAAEGATQAADSAPEAEAPVSGLAPTKDPVRNLYGLELDRFGLPVNGPARAAVLAGMDVSDPVLEPGEWDFRGAKRAAEVMEKIYG